MAQTLVRPRLLEVPASIFLLLTIGVFDGRMISLNLRSNLQKIGL